jgi:N-acetylglucosamine-6-phosphate deacetylase
MTIAPEHEHALETIDALRAGGVIAAVGHTDATYDQTAMAFAHGAGLVTHLCNGMPPMHHREPGPVLASLDAGVACEIINDGRHVHESVLRMVVRRDPDMLVLVTDAMSATGMGDGDYLLGGRRVTVVEGEVRLPDNGSLAGSTLTMDVALQRAVRHAGLSLEVAVRAASTNPARVLGLLHERGDLRPGMRADLVHLDDDLNVLAVMLAGRWV